MHKAFICLQLLVTFGVAFSGTASASGSWTSIAERWGLFRLPQESYADNCADALTNGEGEIGGSEKFMNNCPKPVYFAVCSGHFIKHGAWAEPEPGTAGCWLVNVPSGKEILPPQSEFRNIYMVSNAYWERSDASRHCRDMLKIEVSNSPKNDCQ